MLLGFTAVINQVGNKSFLQKVMEKFFLQPAEAHHAGHQEKKITSMSSLFRTTPNIQYKIDGTWRFLQCFICSFSDVGVKIDDLGFL